MQTIGIIGMGAIGNSTAYILQKAGLDVIVFKPKNSKYKDYKALMENGNISIINHTNSDFLKQKDTLNVTVTSSLQDIVDKSDLILNCCRFPQNSIIYSFNDFQMEIIKRKKIPILAFPGKLGSSWFIGKGKIEVGMIGYSPVFATKKIVDTPLSSSITINILDFKYQIPLAYDDWQTRMILLDFLNKHFPSKNNTQTFIDGGSTLQTALNSPIVAINAAAICDNAQNLIQSKGSPIKEAIYKLSEEYSDLFQAVFEEQRNISKLLDIQNSLTIKDWLKNRLNNTNLSTVTEMLHEIYSNKLVSISGNDRRLTEEYHALLFFKSFANELGCKTPITERLITEMKHLKKTLSPYYFFQDMDFAIQQTGIRSAKNLMAHFLEVA